MTQPVSQPPARPHPEKPPARDEQPARAPFEAELQRALSREPLPADEDAGAAEDALRSFQDISFLASALQAPGPDGDQDSPIREVSGLQREVPVPQESPGNAPRLLPEARGPGAVAIMPTAGSANMPLAASPGPSRAGPDSPSFSPQSVARAPVDTRSQVQISSAREAAPPQRGAPAQLQGHFVSLVQGERGVEVRVRTSGMDARERLQIEGEVAAYLAGHGIRISALSIEGAGQRPESSPEEGTWTR